MAWSPTSAGAAAATGAGAGSVQNRATWWQQSGQPTTVKQEPVKTLGQGWSAGGVSTVPGGPQLVQPRAMAVVPPNDNTSAAPGVQNPMVSAPGVVTPAAAAAAAAGTYVVFSKAGENSEVVVKTLVGEYQEQGTNHNRKVYVRKSVASRPENVDVYMYYWDDRDGPSFQGWWFGNQVGGSQVWSHNPSGSQTPPPTGWRIPWDGAPSADLSVVNKAERQQSMAQARNASAAAAAGPAQQVAISARERLQRAKTALGSNNLAELKVSDEELTPLQPQIAEALKGVMESQASGGAGPQLQGLVNNLKALQQQVAAELQKVKNAAWTVESQQAEQAAMQGELSKFQEALTESQTKVFAAEDAVEKVLITYEMIDGAAEDLNEAKHAVTLTEQAIQEAMKALADARAVLTQRGAEARRMTNNAAKAQATDGVNQLMEQLQTAQTKLQPCKNARQELQQREQAQKVAQEILSRLTAVELDVDKAEEAGLMLSAAEGKDSAAMNRAENSLKKATNGINGITAMITTKRKNAVGAVAQELTKLEDRVKTSTDRMTELRNTIAEAANKIKIQGMMDEAATMVQQVGQKLTAAADAEAPFLLGVEDLPLPEAVAAVKAIEDAAAAAQSALTAARTFVATRMVEAKRLTDSTGQSCQAQLKEHQAQIEKYTKKLNEIKGITTKRKRRTRVREAEAEAEKAIVLAGKVEELSKQLEDNAEFAKMSVVAIKSAADAVQRAEAQASQALSKAREFITARQLEIKGEKDATPEDSTVLIKLQTKLSSTQNQVAKFKQASASVESRLMARRAIEEVQSKIKEAEAKVAQAEKLFKEPAPSPASASSAKPSSAVPPSEPPPAGPSKAGKGKEAFAKGKGKMSKGKGQEAETPSPAPPSSATTVEKALVEATAAVNIAARFLEAKVKQNSNEAVKRGIEELTPQVDKLKVRIETIHDGLRQRADQAVMAEILGEARDKVVELEKAAKRAADAEAPLSAAVEAAEMAADGAAPMVGAADDVAKTLAELEGAVSAAGSLSNTTRTCLAMKRLAAKRLGDSIREKLTKGLEELQVRHDTAVAIVGESKKALNGRKMAAVKLEVTSTIGRMERLAVRAAEAMQSLPDDVDKRAAALSKAEELQKEASAAISSCRTLLVTRQREVKTMMPSEVVLQKEILKGIETSAKLHTDLERQKVTFRETEKKASAVLYQKKAAAALEKLEERIKEVQAEATQIIEEDQNTQTGLRFVVAALRFHLRETASTVKDLFDKMVGDAPKLTQDALSKYLSSVSLEATAAQVKEAFNAMDTASLGQVSLEEFNPHFAEVFTCVSPATMSVELCVRTGTLMRKVEVGEVLHGLRAPEKDEDSGLMRVLVRAEKDKKEGYITIAGNQGTRFLEIRSADDQRGVKLDATFALLDQAIKDCEKTWSQCNDDLNKTSGGPPVEVKVEMNKIRSRIQQITLEHGKLKRTLQDVVRKRKLVLEKEQQKIQEIAEARETAEFVKGATSAVERVSARAEEAIAAADAVHAKSKDVKALVEIATEADEAMQGLKGALASVSPEVEKLKSKLEVAKPGAKGVRPDIKTTFTKLRVRLVATEGKLKSKITDLAKITNALEEDAQNAVFSAFRTAARGKKSGDALFEELSNSSGVITKERFADFVLRSPEAPPRAHLEIGLRQFATHGVSRMAFISGIEEYMKCVKEIAITDVCEVGKSKTIRKLNIGEIVQALEAGTIEPENGLERVRCRVVSDGLEGWVTLRGNKGSSFFEATQKSFQCAAEPLSLEANFEPGKEIRKTRLGEVFEVLEGPRMEAPTVVQRLRCKLQEDGQVGWATLSDSLGVCLELTKVFVCSKSAALTSDFDISVGKPVRKVDIGEVLHPVEGSEPVKDKANSLTRQLVKAARDGKSGWLTIEGSHGSTYVSISDKVYVCRRSIPLERSLQSGTGTPIKQVEVGAVLEAVGMPQSDTRPGCTRIKLRSVVGGVGKEAGLWCTPKPTALKEWSRRYKCVQLTAMSEGPSSSSKVRRKVESGELLEALDFPISEQGSNLLRVMCKASKDGEVGFVTVRGTQGTAILELQ